MRNAWKIAVAGLGILLRLAGTSHAGERELPLEFTGGHDIGRDDYGRPVPLYAAALSVKPDDFRKAFSGVHPARGRAPSDDEARRNKATLMKVLGPLRVTNDRLDAVANYYRFQPQNGELWKTTSAKGYAVVENGKVGKIVVTDAGNGYSSPPKATIKGMPGVALEAVIHFDKDLGRNGSIEAVEVAEVSR